MLASWKSILDNKDRELKLLPLLSAVYNTQYIFPGVFPGFIYFWHSLTDLELTI